jgi:hypothetical protein
MPADYADHKNLILETMQKRGIEPTLRNYIELAYMNSKSAAQIIADDEEELCELVDMVQTGELRDVEGDLDASRDNADPV